MSKRHLKQVSSGGRNKSALQRAKGRAIQEEETASAKTLEYRKAWQALGIELPPGV